VKNVPNEKSGSESYYSKGSELAALVSSNGTGKIFYINKRQ
jgi:hypothetical protein